MLAASVLPDLPRHVVRCSCGSARVTALGIIGSYCVLHAVASSLPLYIAICTYYCTAAVLVTIAHQWASEYPISTYFYYLDCCTIYIIVITLARGAPMGAAPWDLKTLEFEGFFGFRKIT